MKERPGRIDVIVIPFLSLSMWLCLFSLLVYMPSSILGSIVVCVRQIDLQIARLSPAVLAAL